MRQWSLTAPTGDGTTKDLVMTVPAEMILLSYVIASNNFDMGTHTKQDVVIYLTDSGDTEYYKATHEILLGGQMASDEDERALMVVKPNISVVMTAGDKFKIVTSSTQIMCVVKGLIC